jgi:hypothetical protein
MVAEGLTQMQAAISITSCNFFKQKNTRRVKEKHGEGALLSDLAVRE